jgi:hypothetical protein
MQRDALQSFALLATGTLVFVTPALWAFRRGAGELANNGALSVPTFAAMFAAYLSLGASVVAASVLGAWRLDALEAVGRTSGKPWFSLGWPSTWWLAGNFARFD